MTDYCSAARAHPLLQAHHDDEHGFPVHDDDKLFEYLLLEINQAGLAWLTVIKKREALRAAYANFSCVVVARFGDDDIARLMADSSIIRNRYKVEAAIFNAQKICEMQKTYGSFAAWLNEQILVSQENSRPRARSREEWVKLFRKNFRFVGYEIVGEFLMGVGYMQGAHIPSCPVFKRVLAKKPPWIKNQDKKPR